MNRINEWGLAEASVVAAGRPATPRLIGASIGAVAGGFLGALVLNPIAGAVLGAGLGGYLGKPTVPVGVGATLLPKGINTSEPPGHHLCSFVECCCDPVRCYNVYYSC